MTIEHTKNLLNFWNDKFSGEDFNILISCVDKAAGNQTFGKNNFLLILSRDQRKLTQLIMTIKNIIGLVHCQHLSNSIDIGNYRTKLYTSPFIDKTVFSTINQICSFEYRQLTHTNSNVICASNDDLELIEPLQQKAIIINML